MPSVLRSAYYRGYIYYILPAFHPPSTSKTPDLPRIYHKRICVIHIWHVSREWYGSECGEGDGILVILGSGIKRRPREEVGHLADVENTLARNLSFLLFIFSFFASFGRG